jgi:hypothetical protein
LKAEVARADPQLVSQVDPCLWHDVRGPGQLADHAACLLCHCGGGRGRDVEELPVAFPQGTKLHGEPGVDRAKEEVRYNGCRCGAEAGAVVGGELIRLTVDMVRKFKRRQKSDQIRATFFRYCKVEAVPRRWGYAVVVSLTANPALSQSPVVPSDFVVSHNDRLQRV